MTATKKTYQAIYLDKGYRLVDQDTAGDELPRPKSRALPPGKQSESKGSAADIAAGLGLDEKTGPEPDAGRKAKTTDTAAAGKPAMVSGERAAKKTGNEGKFSEAIGPGDADALTGGNTGRTVNDDAEGDDENEVSFGGPATPPREPAGTGRNRNS